MKTISFIVFLFAFLLSGCKQAAEPASSVVYVKFEIESAFQDDSVKLTLEDRTLPESPVTTD